MPLTQQVTCRAAPHRHLKRDKVEYVVTETNGADTIEYRIEHKMEDPWKVPLPMQAGHPSLLSGDVYLPHSAEPLKIESALDRHDKHKVKVHERYRGRSQSRQRSRSMRSNSRGCDEFSSFYHPVPSLAGREKQQVVLKERYHGIRKRSRSDPTTYKAVTLPLPIPTTVLLGAKDKLKLTVTETHRGNAVSNGPYDEIKLPISRMGPPPPVLDKHDKIDFKLKEKKRGNGNTSAPGTPLADSFAFPMEDATVNRPSTHDKTSMRYREKRRLGRSNSFSSRYYSPPSTACMEDRFKLKIKEKFTGRPRRYLD